VGTFLRLLSLSSLAAVLAGCGSLPMPAGTIDGHDAMRAVVTVPREQKVTLEDGRGFTLPAGHYRSIIDDDEGIYFHAPRMVTLEDKTLFGRTLEPKLHDGGIYLRREETHRPSIYFEKNTDKGSELQRKRSQRPSVFDLRKGEHLVFTLSER